MIVPITQGIDTFSGVATASILVIIGVAFTLVASRHAQNVNVRLACGLSALASSVVLIILIAAGGELLADEIAWHSLGAQAAEYLSGETTDRVVYVDGKEGYVWIVGALYAIAGPVPLVPIVVNIIFSVMTVLAVARTTQLVIEDFPGLTAKWRRNAVATAAYLSALLPSLFIWTPRVLRESLSIMLISIAVLGCVLLVRRGQARFLLLAGVTIVVLAWIRGPIGMALGVALAVAVVLVWSGKSSYYLAIRFFLLIPLAVALFGAWTIASAQFGLSTEEVALRNRALATEASSGFSGASQATGSQGYATILLVNVPRILAGPFPWEFDPTSTSMLLAFLEGTIWVIAVLLALRSLWVRRRASTPQRLDKIPNIGSAMLVLLLSASAMLATMSISIANYGLLARLRPMALIIVIPLAAIALSYRPIKRTRQLMTSTRRARFEHARQSKD